MANELLDFVMSLVRDPDAAARYAQDPNQAIADAHLTDVTSADVNGLIPVVSESLSTAAPTFGAHTGADSNVWTSGAATAAFDAFSDHAPDHVVDEGHPVVTDVLDQHADGVPAAAGPDLHTIDAGQLDHSGAVEDFHIDDAMPMPDDVRPVDHPLIPDHDPGADGHGFDIFH